MGTIVSFADLSYRETATGVTRAAITGAEMKEMAAEVIRLEPGARVTESVPSGADRYLFTLTGGVTVSGHGASHAMAEGSFAAVQEGTEFTVANQSGAEATLIGVLPPPPGSPAARMPDSREAPPWRPGRRLPCTTFLRRRSAASISSARRPSAPSAPTR